MVLLSCRASLNSANEFNTLKYNIKYIANCQPKKYLIYKAVPLSQKLQQGESSPPHYFANLYSSTAVSYKLLPSESMTTITGSSSTRIFLMASVPRSS